MASSRKPNKARKPRSRTHLIQKRLTQHEDNTALDQTSPCRCSVSPTTKTTTTSSSSLSSLSTRAPRDTNQEYSFAAAAEDDNPPPSPSGGCCTPKSKKSRIPEVLTCPPAPKKLRVVPCCTLRRRPIAFFAPPDIELFFVFALGEQVN